MSFISPSVLPLVPGYLAFISAVSLEGAKRHVAFTAIFFVLGFSLVFIALGSPATVAGQFILQQATSLAKVAGVLLVIFGLHTIGVFRIPFLLNKARVDTPTTPASLLAAIVVGSSIAFGWTPSIGPTLAAILTLASQEASVDQGVLLLSIYSLGLAIPFLLTSLATHRCSVAFSGIRRHHHAIEIVSGVLMIVTGVLIFTNRFTIIALSLTPYLPTF